MLSSFYPYEYADSVFSIDYEKLSQAGFKAVIFDIDNTLVPHGEDSTGEVDELFVRIHACGLKTLLLSNNSVERIERFKANIDTLYISEADKPETGAYFKALEMLRADSSEAVVVGDQVFTDVLGANRAGIASILVRFIRRPGERKIGIRRRVEAVVLFFYKLSGKYKHRLGDILKTEE